MRGVFLAGRSGTEVAGLIFSFHVRRRSVAVWVGDYLHHAAASAVLPSLEQAIEWLKHYTGQDSTERPDPAVS